MGATQNWRGVKQLFTVEFYVERMRRKQTLGFTLIELSIVLVIIGLIVGGILVGQDLVEGARIRAQITQIEKYQTAFATFKGKYGGLPGDLVSRRASQFGFATRAGTNGHGDGDGLYESCIDVAMIYSSNYYVGCETLLVWRDLAEAGLIPGDFSTNSDAPLNTSPASADGTHFPQASYGGAIDLHVWATGNATWGWPQKNRPFLTAVNINGTADASGIMGVFDVPPQFPNIAVYEIDRKIDDGFPCTGKVLGLSVGAVIGETCSTVLTDPCYVISGGLTFGYQLDPNAAGTTYCTVNVPLF
jgi:prepilin-type N-terminal cleavage/methylation domain-containing protein